MTFGVSIFSVLFEKGWFGLSFDQSGERILQKDFEEEGR